MLSGHQSPRTAWDSIHLPVQRGLHRADAVGHMGPLSAQQRPMGWQPNGPRSPLCCTQARIWWGRKTTLTAAPTGHRRRGGSFTTGA
eukprot:4678622-Pyramimonas_sp.AAC.1